MIRLRRFTMPEPQTSVRPKLRSDEDHHNKKNLMHQQYGIVGLFIIGTHYET